MKYLDNSDMKFLENMVNDMVDFEKNKAEDPIGDGFDEYLEYLASQIRKERMDWLRSEMLEAEKVMSGPLQ